MSTDPNAARVAPTEQARILRLEDDADDDLSASTTVQERVAMVAILSRRMWEISGRPWPSYARSEIPIAIVRAG
jgi:hypothetical protein